MINKKLALLVFFSCFSLMLYAQDPIFLNYPQNYLWYNPAHAGVDSTHEVTLTGRSQWDGVYKTISASYEQPLNKINSGIGFLAYYDRSGSLPLETYYAAADYNYNVKIMKDMNLRIGLMAAFDYLHINLQNLTTGSQYNGFQFVPAQYNGGATSEKQYSLDFGAGFWYNYKGLFAAFSIKHIGYIAFNNSDMGNSTPEVGYTAIAGYKWKLTNHFTTIPSLLLTYQGPDDYWQISNDLYLNDTYIMGVGLGPDNNINKFSIRGGIKWRNKILAMFSYAFANQNEIPSPLTKDFTIYEATVKYMFR